MDDPRFAPAVSKQIVPVLPIKNTVLFPYLFMPLSVGRSSSVIAVEAALADEEKTLLVVAQKESSKEEPTGEDLFKVGTRAVIKKMARSPQTVDILVQGMERVEIVSFPRTDPHLEAEVRVLPLPTDEGAELDALFRTVVDQVGKIMEVAQAEGSVAQLVSQAGDPLRFVYLVGSMLGLDVAKEQALLEAGSRLEALRLLNDFL